MGKGFSLADLLWAALFCALLAAVAGAVLYTRNVVLNSADDNAQKDWDDWRQAVKEGKAEEGGVTRRFPKSAEPPGLVLMRDHFAVCLAGALVLSSVLFGAMIFMVRGALATPGPGAAFKDLAEERPE